MIYLKSSVGIEIRNNDLVVSCLRSNFSAGVFTNYKRVADYKSREREEVRLELDRYFKAHRLARENIVLGIPRSDVLIRNLDLPIEVRDNLKQVIQYQVQSFAPSEEEKFYYDYAVMGSQQEEKRLDVLLVMIPKAVLDAHMETINGLGIHPAAVTVGSIALVNLFFQTRPDAGAKLFLLADLKAGGGIELLIVRKGILIYTREAARPEGLGWKGALLKEMELALSKIRLDPEEAVERIVLAGEESEIVQRELKEQLEDCELIGSNIKYEMPLENRAHLQEGAISLGLASAGMVRRPVFAMNLLPPDRRFRQSRWALVPTVLLGLILVLVLAGFAFRPVVQEKMVVRKLDEEISALKPRVGRVQHLIGQVRTLEKQVGYIEGLLRCGDMNLEVLQELTTILPSDTYLVQYSNREGTINLVGLSASADALIPRLERSPFIKDVQQRGAIFRDAQSGKDRFNFETKVEGTTCKSQAETRRF